MNIVTGLLKQIKRDFRLVEGIDYENGYVREHYTDGQDDYQVDNFEGRAHCIINKRTGTQHTRSGSQRFKAG